MNRTFLVLALALLGCGGCRTMGPNCGQACSGPGGESYGQSCDKSCDSCHMMTMKNAPRPEGCCEGNARACGHGGDCETACPGGGCVVFDRYHGSECGPQYPTGPYDCSPCGSCDWAAMGIGIRSDPRVATSATAKTTVASRIVCASIVAVDTAVVARDLVATAVRSAAVGRVAIRITTSIRDRQ